MNKESGLTSKILTGLAAASAAGGIGYGGYKVGEKKGATKAVDKMTVAFAEANQKENRNIVNSFKAFNEKENMDILRRGFQMGVKYKDMSKKAALNEIYDAAFQDELEKLAIPASLTSGMKTLGKSFKNLGKGLAHQGGHASKMTSTKSLAGLKQRVGWMGKSALTSAKKSKAALTTVGVGGAYAAG